jgi:hypothetical protein
MKERQQRPGQREKNFIEYINLNARAKLLRSKIHQNLGGYRLACELTVLHCGV